MAAQQDNALTIPIQPREWKSNPKPDFQKLVVGNSKSELFKFLIIAAIVVPVTVLSTSS
jgi:hypothetical protein